ncbi:uncharacterized protein LOC117884652 [Trachemys scripta elegans]|uniref:uncharacterized protein LOC117884652 n=1 Tax=Trachemys scripta elegans TaxID=31138 RepID=UPI0015532F34|nr:uncharacterized protein LOC117884652 [Trachemys scripta elegans]
MPTALGTPDASLQGLIFPSPRHPSPDIPQQYPSKQHQHHGKTEGFVPPHMRISLFCLRLIVIESGYPAEPRNGTQCARRCTNADPMDSPYPKDNTKAQVSCLPYAVHRGDNRSHRPAPWREVSPRHTPNSTLAAHDPTANLPPQETLTRPRYRPPGSPAVSVHLLRAAAGSGLGTNQSATNEESAELPSQLPRALPRVLQAAPGFSLEEPGQVNSFFAAGSLSVR